MATTTFIPAPDYGCQLQKKPRIRTAQFGDGYQQRVADGINTSPEEWTLTFSARVASEANEILQFLEARGGIESFWWTSPRETVGRFICPEWTHAPNNHYTHTITATFRQVYEPGDSGSVSVPTGAIALPGGYLVLG